MAMDKIMMFVWLSRALMATAFSLVVLSLVLFFKRGPESLAAAIKPPAVIVDLKEIQAHVKTPFQFKLANEDSRTWKVVGTPSICSKTGCVWAVDPPVDLAPNQSVTFQFLCDASQSGPFDLETAIYLEAGQGEGITVPVIIKGAARVSPLGPDVPR